MLSYDLHVRLTITDSRANTVGPDRSGDVQFKNRTLTCWIFAEYWVRGRPAVSLWGCEKLLTRAGGTPCWYPRGVPWTPSPSMLSGGRPIGSSSSLMAEWTVHSSFFAFIFVALHVGDYFSRVWNHLYYVYFGHRRSTFSRGAFCENSIQQVDLIDSWN